MPLMQTGTTIQAAKKSRYSKARILTAARKMAKREGKGEARAQELAAQAYANLTTREARS